MGIANTAQAPAGAAVLLWFGWIAGGNCRWELQVCAGHRCPVPAQAVGCHPSAPPASRQRGQALLPLSQPDPLSLRFDVSLHTHGSHTSVSCAHHTPALLDTELPAAQPGEQSRQREG